MRTHSLAVCNALHSWQSIYISLFAVRYTLQFGTLHYWQRVHTSLLAACTHFTIGSVYTLHYWQRVHTSLLAVCNTLNFWQSRKSAVLQTSCLASLVIYSILSL